jgi:hypothetical protein
VALDRSRPAQRQRTRIVFVAVERAPLPISQLPSLVRRVEPQHKELGTSTGSATEASNVAVSYRRRRFATVPPDDTRGRTSIRRPGCRARRAGECHDGVRRVESQIEQRCREHGHDDVFVVNDERHIHAHDNPSPTQNGPPHELEDQHEHVHGGREHRAPADAGRHATSAGRPAPDDRVRQL